MSSSAPSAPRRHALSDHEFAALAAGGGDEHLIGRLLDVERSRRLLLLRTILDAVAARPGTAGPMPALEDAWRLLAAAQRRAPEVVDDVLIHPHTGTWAGTVLRRLEAGGPTEPRPLWTDLAYLHGLAATAAIRAGLDFEGQVVVHRGAAVLPSLGFAGLPADGEWEVAAVRGGSGRARIEARGARVELPHEPGTDAPGWSGLRRLRAKADGRVYTLSLDDVDPYRETGRVLPPQRLGDTAIDRWSELFTEAWELLARHHAEAAIPLAAGLRTLVPRPAVRRFRTFSASAEESVGCAIASLPPDAATLAMTLLHEFQHSKLSALLHLVPLWQGDSEELLYAPWRPDPRPPAGLLQGVYAFLAVAAFWRRQREVTTGDAARFAHFEFAHWRLQTWRAWQALRSQPGLTGLGRRFADGMGARLEPWQAESVPPTLLAAAESVAADHRASWRVRHVHPAPADVDPLANAWLDGRPRPALPVRETVSAVARSAPRDGRTTLTRLRVADPDAFRAFLTDPPPDEIADLVPGDIAYAAGHPESAAHAYREQIQTDPDRLAAWVGLGLAEAALGHTAAAAGLLERPELVRAVYLELSLRKDTPPDPSVLAAWIGS